MTPFGKRDDDVDAKPKPRPGPPVPPEPTPKPLPRPRPHGSEEREELAERSEPSRPAARSSEVRPFLIGCPVCLKKIGGVEVDIVATPEPLMPAHAYEPGYKCMGSGVKGVLLGRGDVIVDAVPPSRSVPAEVPGQWGVR